MRLQPLGDQAILAYWPDETAAVAFADRARELAEPWLIDVVVAYTSVAVFFDLDRTRFDQVAERLQRLAAEPAAAASRPSRLHRISCCYTLGPDLDRVARHTGLSADQVVALHTGAEYTVYAIGFSPGFPYLGYLPEPLCGVPRLESPRLRVESGSVGLTGRQTGIYPEPRPGGWNLIGRTPLELVSVADDYFPLRPGDRVRFEAIDKAEFHRLLGRRLH